MSHTLYVERYDAWDTEGERRIGVIPNVDDEMAADLHNDWAQSRLEGSCNSIIWTIECMEA